MDRPYYFRDFEIIQLCTTAVVLAWIIARQRSVVRAVLLSVALVLVALAPAIGPTDPPSLIAPRSLCTVAAVLTAAAMLHRTSAWRNAFAAAALVTFFAAWHAAPEAPLSLAAGQMLWIAWVAALGTPTLVVMHHAAAKLTTVHVALFVVAVAVGAHAATAVLERHILSGDEWANTYQADVFGHLRAFGTPRECPRVFQAWWVLDWQGRSFAQYTPGWPFFMAPFQRVGIVWLAGPVMLGILVVAVARLARRFAPANPIAASVVAGAVTMASPALVLNAASRYPHTMVCACLAWMIECLAEMIESVPRANVSRAAWAVGLGTSAALLLATRPLDGATLGLPVAAYFVYAVSKRRIAPRLIACTVVPFVAVAASVLVVLRLQVGTWLTTGYATAEKLRELSGALFSLPTAVEALNSLGFDKALSWWWPAIPAIAIVGMVTLWRRAPVVSVVLVAGTVLHTIAYTLVSFGRNGDDSGYSPRYHLPIVVVVAVFTSALLVEVGRSAWIVGGVACASLAFGTFAIATTAYPLFHRVLHEKRALVRAIEEAHPHHAMILVHAGDVAVQPWDVTQNLPPYDDPDVLVATDYGAGDDLACARRRYADRAWYEAKGQADVVLTPVAP